MALDGNSNPKYERVMRGVVMRGILWRTGLAHRSGHGNVGMVGARVAAALVAVMVLCSVGPAQANPSERLIRQGVELRRKGQDERA